MKKEQPNKSAQEFADTIKDNPKEIIKWCRAEISAYNELISLLEKKICKKKKNQKRYLNAREDVKTKN